MYRKQEQKYPLQKRELLRMPLCQLDWRRFASVSPNSISLGGEIISPSSSQTRANCTTPLQVHLSTCAQTLSNNVCRYRSTRPAHFSTSAWSCPQLGTGVYERDGQIRASLLGSPHFDGSVRRLFRHYRRISRIISSAIYFHRL